VCPKHADLNSSARTWKSKLKEWKFDKYLVDREKDVSIAKVAKRTREGKTTALLREDRQISPGRLADFKRRKRENSVVVVSPSTGELFPLGRTRVPWLTLEFRNRRRLGMPFPIERRGSHYARSHKSEAV
jgi:hypothetical protein